jgi:hypothetical protein
MKTNKSKQVSYDETKEFTFTGEELLKLNAAFSKLEQIENFSFETALKVARNSNKISEIITPILKIRASKLNNIPRVEAKDHNGLTCTTLRLDNQASVVVKTEDYIKVSDEIDKAFEKEYALNLYTFAQTELQVSAEDKKSVVNAGIIKSILKLINE